MTPTEQRPEDARPFVVPCATLDMGAPWRWLRAGWRDLRAAPGLSLLFGLVIVLVSAGISLLAWTLGRFALLATLLSGFVFVAPLICVGLYCVSRALEKGQRPTLADSFVLARRVIGQARAIRFQLHARQPDIALQFFQLSSIHTCSGNGHQWRWFALA